MTATLLSAIEAMNAELQMRLHMARNALQKAPPPPRGVEGDILAHYKCVETCLAKMARAQEALFVKPPVREYLCLPVGLSPITAVLEIPGTTCAATHAAAGEEAVKAARDAYAAALQRLAAPPRPTELITARPS